MPQSFQGKQVCWGSVCNRRSAVDHRIPLVTLGDEDGKVSFFVHGFTVRILQYCFSLRHYPVLR